MPELLIANENDIKDNVLDEIASQARHFESEADSKIEAHADLEIDNPEMLEYLETFLDDDNDYDTFMSGGPSADPRGADFNLLLFRHRKLKNKINRVFCKVVYPMLKKDGEINLNDLVKALLVALIPVLAGSGGVAVILLPIIVAIIAKYLKRGVDSVCA